jgi:hypothetical protein
VKIDIIRSAMFVAACLISVGCPVTTDASTTSSEMTHADVGMVREFEIKD